MIATVTEADLPELLPLMRGYCDFYEVDPSDDDLLGMSRVLIADPEREGTQLIARDDEGRALGFATIFWTWSTLSASRIGVMNDLFVAERARGTGVAEALIAACAEQSRGTAPLARLDDGPGQPPRPARSTSGSAPSATSAGWTTRSRCCPAPPVPTRRRGVSRPARARAPGGAARPTWFRLLCMRNRR